MDRHLLPALRHHTPGPETQRPATGADGRPQGHPVPADVLQRDGGEHGEAVIIRRQTPQQNPDVV